MVDHIVPVALANDGWNRRALQEGFQRLCIHGQKALSFCIDFQHADRCLQRAQLFNVDARYAGHRMTLHVRSILLLHPGQVTVDSRWQTR